MKWAKMNKGSSNSSHSFFMNHVFPNSWLSKLKLIFNGGCSENFPKQNLMQGHEASRKNKDKNFEKFKSRTLKEKQSEQIAAKEEEKLVFEVQPESITRTKSDTTKNRRSFSYPNCNFSSIEQECLLGVLNLDDPNSLSKIQAKGINNKNDQRRYSEDRNSKKKKRYKKRMKPYSPRTTPKTECKIRAIEDMKKSKKRGKKKADKNCGFESYAVIKNSFDPKRDFTDSMIEMIVVKGITKPEELEKLLVCYLTLNCDEYHDMIIKVFQQVWFELNQMYQDHIYS